MTTFQTTLEKKPSCHQNYLHSKSEDPYLLKKIITYSQTLSIKLICPTATKYWKQLKIHLWTTWHQLDNVRKGIEKAAEKEPKSILNKQIEESK